MGIRDKFSYMEIARRRIREIKDIYDVGGLGDVIFELENLSELGYYEKLYEAYNNFSGPFEKGDGLSDEDKRNNKLLMLAYENLDHPPIKLPKISDTVDFFDFYFLYPFLELVYFMNVERKLEAEDVKRIFLSNLGERIVFFLDEFDTVTKTPEPTLEFFLKLKKVRWKNKESRSLLDRLNEIKEFVVYDMFGYLSGAWLQGKEEILILFFAGCSAVNDERDKIIEFDVVRAYKTYFKLIKTDITKLIDGNTTSIARLTDNGYLVCDKCNEYYKLQPGESPEDFTDKCECGGSLKYFKDVDWLFYEKE